MALIDPNAQDRERRSLMGMLLLLGFFLIWMNQMAPRELPPNPNQDPPGTPAALPDSVPDAPPPPPPPAALSISDIDDLSLSNEHMLVLLSNRGATVPLVLLKDFAPPGKPELKDLGTPESWNPFAHGIEFDLDSSPREGDRAVPALAHEDFHAIARNALRFEWQRPRDHLVGKSNWQLVESEPGTVVFSSRGAGKLRALKTFSIDDGPWPGTESTGGHRLRLDIAITNDAEETQAVEFSVFGLSGSNTEGSFRGGDLYRNPQIAYTLVDSDTLQVNNKLKIADIRTAIAERQPAEDAHVLSNQDLDPGIDRILWLAAGNHYFAGVLAPSIETRELISGVRFQPLLDTAAYEEALAEASQQRAPVDNEKLLTKNTVGVAGAFDVVLSGLKPGETRTATFHFYVGPRSKSYIEPMELSDLVRSVPICGVIQVGPFARALTWCLVQVHHAVPNYGWAIIILTIIIKVVLMPINRRNQVSMAKYGEKMKKFAPRQKEVEAKYKGKSDAASQQKKRQEMAQAMRDAGITMPIPPGCLLMLLQMPIFVGLFSALQNSIELRHASWLYVDDLSSPDQLFQLPFEIPFFGEYFNLLPVIMTVVWWLQSKMSMKLQHATTMDDQQKMTMKMMAYMPIFFGVMFYNGPAGLVLYWTVSTLISVLEFRFFRKAREKAVDADAAAAPAAESAPAIPAAPVPSGKKKRKKKGGRKK